jgi:hypothetical protein
LFNFHSEHLTKEALGGFEEFKIAQAIDIVKYGEGLEPLQIEETV